MGAIHFLLLVAMCQSLAIDKASAGKELPAPDISKSQSIVDPVNKNPSQKLTWTAVDSGDEADPVIGYKLKVWVVNKIKKIVYKKQGDEFVPTEQEEYQAISNAVMPEGTPTVLTVPANETTAVYPVDVGVAYQFAILAFTKTSESQLSSPTRVRLQPHEDDLKSGIKTT